MIIDTKDIRGVFLSHNTKGGAVLRLRLEDGTWIEVAGIGTISSSVNFEDGVVEKRQSFDFKEKAANGS